MSLRRLVFTLLAFALLTPLPAATTPKEDAALAELIQTQKKLFADAENQGDSFDRESFHTQLQQLCQRYDQLLHNNAEFTSAYVAYGLLLSKAGMRKESTALFHRANQLDKNIPLVKNQIGNYLAEEGKPLEASNFYLAAIQLAPSEPLYHFQLGTLLTEARDDFIKSGNYTRTSLDQAAHEAFRQATTLAPDDWRYAYSYGLSFYDLEKPDWPAALAFWQTFETKLKPGVEQQVARLHQAKIHFTLGHPIEAHALLETVTELVLAKQKAKVLADLTPAPTPTPAAVAPSAPATPSEPAH